MYTYAIIIVTFNRLSLLKECLEHVAHQSISPSAIVVVDNCCTDGSSEYLDKYAKKSPLNIMIVHMTENMGGAGGFEQGLRTAINDTDAEWFMLIDDDAILDYKCMEQLIPDSKSTSLAYACAVYTGGQIVTMHRRRDDTPVSVSEYSSNSFTCNLASFCGLTISRRLVKNIGYPCGNYFIWFDDTEYCMRMKSFTAIKVCPQATLNHKVELRSSTEEIDSISWKNYYGTRNSIQTYKKHRQWRKFIKTIYHALRSSLHLAIRGNNGAARLFLSAAIDALFDRMGKNQRYLPGVKY